MNDTPPTGRDPDRHIVERVLEGDAEHYRLLVDRYRGDLFAYAWAMTGDASRAEEAVNQGLLHAFNGLARIPDRGNFRPFAMRGVRHETHQALSEAKAQDGGFSQEDERALHRALAARATSPDVVPAIARALLHLPAGLREAWVLCHMYDMGDEELAYIEGVSGQTVRRKAGQARAFLVELARKQEADTTDVTDTTNTTDTTDVTDTAGTTDTAGHRDPTEQPDPAHGREDATPPDLFPAADDSAPSAPPMPHA